MSLFVVDVESDGPIPADYSMVCFGAVLVDKAGKLDKTFYGRTRPITPNYNQEALAISGFSRVEHKTFDEPKEVMLAFKQWIYDVNEKGRPVFITDNPAYDFAWINFYFHRFIGDNPFGFSARRIGDIYCGLMKDPYAKWKHLRKTKHTHNPVDDAKGNAEVILAMNKMGIDLVK